MLETGIYYNAHVGIYFRNTFWKQCVFDTYLKLENKILTKGSLWKVLTEYNEHTFIFNINFLREKYQNHKLNKW